MEASVLDDLLLSGPSLDVRIWDDPILSTVCQPVRDSEFGPKLEQLSQKMVEAMHKHRGVGLAAPQVGVPLRMFVMAQPELDTPEGFVFCNPKLVLEGDEIQGEEGCLSLPGVRNRVTRSSAVLITYFTPRGVEMKESFSFLDARIAQHENDHLDGIMFFQRLSRQAKRDVLRRWEKKNDQN